MGLTDAQVNHLAQLITDNTVVPGLPPIMSIRQGMIITLIYLRRNRTQEDLAFTYRVSQPTVSRTVAAMTSIFAVVLVDWMPTLDDLPAGNVYVVDGTLVPCWTWADHQELYSGKHKTTGLNLQVVTDLDGRLCWISDPLPGSTHDVTALDMHDILAGQDASQWVADKGYIGRGMITPIKKKPGQDELNNHDRECNKSIHKIRWVAEKAIANLKTWRILYADYRRPIRIFETTISAVTALYFYAASE